MPTTSRSERPAKTVTQKNTPSGRFYTLPDGQDVPSVTHILSVIGKPALVQWAAKTERALAMDAAADLYLDTSLIKTPMSRPTYLATLDGRIGKTKAHQRELGKAAEIGTQAHALIEWNLRRMLGQTVGPEPRVSEGAQWAFMAWEDWARSVDLTPVFVEQTVFSTAYGFAGTMDLYAEVNGVPTVIDWKTSKSIYAEAFLQNVAYRVALREMGQADARQGLIVRIPKVQTDPAFEVAAVPDETDLWPVFLAARRLWTWWYAEELKSKAKWLAARDSSAG